MKKIVFVCLLFVLQSVNALSLSLTNDPVGLDFYPNKPVVINNNNTQNLQYMCEMHVNEHADNTLLIKQVKGSGVVNGTTLEPGRTLYLTIRQLQTMTVLAQKGARLQFTNLGTKLIRGLCYQ